MSRLLIIVLPISFVIGIWFIVLSSMPKHGTIRIDCTWAEISPDMPTKIKEECRKARSGRI
jgi:hypothetical protein